MKEANVSLFNLTEELMALMDAVTAQQGELTEENMANLERLEGLLMSKGEAVYGYRQHLEGIQDQAKKRIDALNELIDKAESRIEWIDRYVRECLERLPLQSIKADLLTIKLRKPTQVVEIFDESLIDIQFIKLPEPKPTIMKAEISKALKAGIEVAGARLIEGKKSVVYKLSTGGNDE
jgi:hypothetical protein